MTPTCGARIDPAASKKPPYDADFQQVETFCPWEGDIGEQGRHDATSPIANFEFEAASPYRRGQKILVSATQRSPTQTDNELKMVFKFLVDGR